MLWGGRANDAGEPGTGGTDGGGAAAGAAGATSGESVPAKREGRASCALFASVPASAPAHASLQSEAVTTPSATSRVPLLPSARPCVRPLRASMRSQRAPSEFEPLTYSEERPALSERRLYRETRLRRRILSSCPAPVLARRASRDTLAPCPNRAARRRAKSCALRSS